MIIKLDDDVYIKSEKIDALVCNEEAAYVALDSGLSLTLRPHYKEALISAMSANSPAAKAPNSPTLDKPLNLAEYRYNQGVF
jgi:hypothetical protein